MNIRWIIPVFLCLAMNVMAQTQPSAPPPDAPKAAPAVQQPVTGPRQIPAIILEGKILKLDLEKQRLDLAIIGADGKPDTRSFILGDRTQVYRRGQQLILKDIKTGDHVKIHFAPKEGVMPVANRIILVPAPATPASDHAATKPH